jgi:NAD(P)-dependent dehydrogenase (short-subunit alcohol dehydrogenase family)
MTFMTPSNSGAWRDAYELSAAAPAGASLEFLTADLSSMRTVLDVSEEVARRVPRIDLLIHCVGVIQPRRGRTIEGVEINFASSYLSRFALTEKLAPLLDRATDPRLINVAASAPKVPKFLRVEFDSVAAVSARMGMKGHGQAQLANDIWAAEIARRKSWRVLGYGPGAVATGIRRELPRLLVALVTPFFTWSTRPTAEVAEEIFRIATAPGIPPVGSALFYTKGRFFEAAEFVSDSRRGADLWRVSEQLVTSGSGSRAAI